VDPNKIEAIKDWTHPKTLKILCGFLGLMGYYHQQNYGKTTSPLTALFKKNSFTWNPPADQSFHALKEAMHTTLFMALPNLTKTFVLECDASRKRIMEILMQDGQPLAFTRKQILDKHFG
jgi:hypothetical protein